MMIRKRCDVHPNCVGILLIDVIKCLASCSISRYAEKKLRESHGHHVDNSFANLFPDNGSCYDFGSETWATGSERMGSLYSRKATIHISLLRRFLKCKPCLWGHSTQINSRVRIQSRQTKMMFEYLQ